MYSFDEARQIVRFFNEQNVAKKLQTLIDGGYVKETSKITKD